MRWHPVWRLALHGLLQLGQADACGNGQGLGQALPEPPKSANSGTCRTSQKMDL